jgi:hypothetical protein
MILGNLKFIKRRIRMIGLIGLMVGAYICTQMLETLFKKQELEFRTAGRIILILAASITILLSLVITVVCILPSLS